MTELIIDKYKNIKNKVINSKITNLIKHYSNQILSQRDNKIEEEYKQFHKMQIKQNENKSKISFLQGDEIWTDIQNCIKNARKSIKILLYHFDNTSSARKFQSLLCEAADRGVQVQVCVDWLNKKLQNKPHPGVDIHIHNNREFFVRSHNKSQIIDDSVYVGSANVGDDQISKEFDGNMTKQDKMVKITGNEQITFTEQYYFNKLKINESDNLNNKIQQTNRNTIISKKFKDYQYNCLIQYSNVQSLYNFHNTSRSKKVSQLGRLNTFLIDHMNQVKCIISPYIDFPDEIKTQLKKNQDELNKKTLLLTVRNADNDVPMHQYMLSESRIMKKQLNTRVSNMKIFTHIKEVQFDQQQLIGSHNLDQWNFYRSHENGIIFKLTHNNWFDKIINLFYRKNEKFIDLNNSSTQFDRMIQETQKCQRRYDEYYVEKEYHQLSHTIKKNIYKWIYNNIMINLFKLTLKFNKSDFKQYKFIDQDFGKINSKQQFLDPQTRSKMIKDQKQIEELQWYFTCN